MEGDELNVYIDGEKIEYLKSCDVGPSEEIKDVIVSTSSEYICLDEMFVYPSIKTEDEIKQLYNATVFGK